MKSARKPPKSKPERRIDKAAPNLPDPQEQAVRHKSTRLARAGEVAQDYVEVIADLIDSTGEARLIDIARRLGVTHVTVNRTVARLHRDDLVTNLPYRSVFLTVKGRKLAEQVRWRHQIVVALLEAVGVPPVTARIDAEGIEHHVSKASLTAFERFLEKGKKSR